MSPAQAARELNVGIQHIYKLLYSGKLRGTRRERRWAISPAAVVERREAVRRYRRGEAVNA